MLVGGGSGKKPQCRRRRRRRADNIVDSIGPSMLPLPGLPGGTCVATAVVGIFTQSVNVFVSGEWRGPKQMSGEPKRDAGLPLPVHRSDQTVSPLCVCHNMCTNYPNVWRMCVSVCVFVVCVYVFTLGWPVPHLIVSHRFRRTEDKRHGPRCERSSLWCPCALSAAVAERARVHARVPARNYVIEANKYDDGFNGDVNGGRTVEMTSFLANRDINFVRNGV